MEETGLRPFAAVPLAFDIVGVSLLLRFSSNLLFKYLNELDRQNRFTVRNAHPWLICFNFKTRVTQTFRKLLLNLIFLDFFFLVLFYELKLRFKNTNRTERQRRVRSHTTSGNSSCWFFSIIKNLIQIRNIM